MPEVSGTRGAKTNWSGEIIADKWMHVAIVNDEVTHETVLYIEGAPVLRNASNAPGLAALAANMPWIIGAGSWMADAPTASSAASARSASWARRSSRRSG